jgi:glutamine---fructose-6-phosphate transaminase (isomerizing)
MTSFLEQEIHEQPAVIERLLSTQAETATRIARAVHDFAPTFVCIAARGTSDNAARYAQYLFATHARLSVALATPSVHTLYHNPPRLERALVIGISQSGQSEDIRQVLQDARDQGALTVSITNDISSPLAQMAHYHLPLHAGPERSVAATKTYTAQLAAVALLVSALMDDAPFHHTLEQVPGWMQTTLEASQRIHDWITDFASMDRYACIGRGYNYCTAFEISLKVKELCYIAGEGYSEADFRHGPIALLQPQFPVLLVAPSGATFETQLDLLAQCAQREARRLVISNDARVQPLATHWLSIPETVPEWLSPLVCVLPGQMLAMELARAKGLSLDQPRGLNKVTSTY